METAPGAPEATAALIGMGIFGTIMLIVAAISLVPAIFYLLTMQKALNRCAPESRAMSPALVWLMLIPFFNLVWHFILVMNMAKSLGAEFKARNIESEEAPGKTLGLTMCILGACSLIPIPVVNMLPAIGGMVCWIMYWVKIAGYSKQLV